MTGPFSRTALWAIGGAVAASLIVAVALTVAGDTTPRAPAGADAYSESAIGQKGLVELLQRLDVPVVVSRGDSARKAKHGLLVLDEPKASIEDAAAMRAVIDGAPTVLVVLARWYGRVKHGGHWIDSGKQLPTTDVADTLTALAGDVWADRDVVRVARGRAPARWDVPGFLSQPVLATPQTIGTVDALTTVVTDGDRVLVASFRLAGSTIWVLADPDIVNNAGLRHPENARFAVALIDQLRGDGAVVFDETVHGHTRTPSLFQVLTQFPLVLATMQVLICALIAVWAAMVRFGPRRAAPPPIAPGKDYLIRNTAALLAFGGHHGDALRRYVAFNVAHVRHALRAPEGLAGAQLTAWLERVRISRGGSISLADLEHEATTRLQPQQVVELADRAYRWRMEMTHGPHNRS